MAGIRLGHMHNFSSQLPIFCMSPCKDGLPDFFIDFLMVVEGVSSRSISVTLLKSCTVAWPYILTSRPLSPGLTLVWGLGMGPQDRL